MKRRDILKAGLSILPATLLTGAATGRTGAMGDRSALEDALGGRVKPVDWPLDECIRNPDGSACSAFFEAARNPFFLGDQAGLTQSFGWTGAWTMKPSDRVVEAQTAGDIASAVRFAAARGLRLAVKGGGHSYKGGSNAQNSLLLWTRRMNQIVLHDDFVPTGTDLAPVPAVTVGAGAMWGDVYRAVCVGAGRYVQGGGCLTVGVAGLVQSGGFGSFSKRYGLAAAGLLEAEIVTADGEIRLANAERESELFFALKGGGGGTFGVVTRLTLMTHDLPQTFGAVFAEIRAVSDQAFRSLIARTVAFYADDLFNPHWGEQLRMRPDNTLSISMVFQDLSQQQAETVWESLFDWVRARPDDFRIASDPAILSVPARSFWDPAFLRKLPGVVLDDTQPGASKDRIFWSGNREESGQVIHAYRSAWLPAALLEKTQQTQLAEALFAASRHWSVSLHANKGLAGATAEVRAAALATAMNPAVVDAFALLICAAEGPPAYPGVAGREPDISRARRDAERVSKAMAALREHISTTGSYLAESDYFEPDWQSAFWGENHSRLLAAKRRYDPGHLFNLRHGVGTA